MKYEYTRGSWRVEVEDTKHEDIKTYNVLAPNPDAGKTGVCYSGAEFMIAHDLDGDGDAHLISAAPDLLDAARLGLARLSRKAETCHNSAWKVNDQEAFDALTAAITKAEGTK